MSMICCACGEPRLRFDFSQNQWSKGEGAARCYECVSEGRFDTARRNYGTKVEVIWSRIHSSGGFRNVYKGRYLDGPRRGKVCVAKLFRDREHEEAYFGWDSKVVEKATEIASAWNRQNRGLPTIQVNQPTTMQSPYGKVQVEPYINTYMKFNSNTGWALSHDKYGYSEMMQALSHFSYHISGGQYVLCDLQGGCNGGPQSVILTDPALMSQNGRFGPTDLGRQGIKDFFSQHQCNYLCQHHWQLPRQDVPLFAFSSGVAVAGTSMRF